MPTSTSLATVGESAQLDASAILTSARTARRAYEDAVNSDGTTSTRWLAIARDMYEAAAQLYQLIAANAVPDGYLVTPGVIQCLTDRARDAEFRAQVADRMVAAARNGRVIDMSTLQAVAS